MLFQDFKAATAALSFFTSDSSRESVSTWLEFSSSFPATGTCKRFITSGGSLWTSIASFSGFCWSSSSSAASDNETSVSSLAAAADPFPVPAGASSTSEDTL